jgi:anti-sigma B factor antagonist
MFFMLFRPSMDFRHNTCSAIHGGRLDINVRKRSQVHLVQLRGPLRMGEAVDGLRQTMEEVMDSGGHYLVINLAEVPMIDSSGIGLLVRFLATTKERGGNIKLLNPSQFAVRTLKMVGVLNLFDVFDDEEKAVESFG